MLSWIILLVTGKIPSHLRAFAFLSFSSCQESLLCEELYSDACFPLVVKHLSVCWNCLSWLCWCSQSCSITALVLDLGYTTEKAQPCAGMVWAYSPQCELQRETKHQSASGRLLQRHLLLVLLLDTPERVEQLLLLCNLGRKTLLSISLLHIHVQKLSTTLSYIVLVSLSFPFACYGA